MWSTWVMLTQVQPPAPLGPVARAKRFYLAHEPLCTVVFFAAGFLFDTLAVGRIDRLHNVIHQASYLSLCAFLTGLELRELHGRFSPPERFKAAWRYHVGATHFMLGTLLNIYTLFFFKSASLGTSFLFLLALVGLLAVNELKPFKDSGTILRMSLFSLCLIAYFTYLVPMLLGSIGAMAFAGSIAAAGACVFALRRLLLRELPRPVVDGHVSVPFALVALAFCALYAAKAIPPVPLSLSSIGIYHDVRREGGRYALTMTRPPWKFWQRGDQTFLARPGDKLHCFVSVFSPTRFSERLQLQWLFLSPAGWQAADAVPLAVVGGRDEGFRADSVKSNYQAGRWRVRVETSDRRELGRIDFTVVDDASSGIAAARTIWR
jgi:hypothetical protein